MQSSQASRFKNKLIITMAIVAFVMFSLNAFVFSILEVKSYTDVDYMIPVFVDVIPYLTMLSELAGVLFSYACIIYASYRFGRDGLVLSIVVYAALTLYKYIAKIASGLIINGSISALKGILSLFFYSVVLPFLLDAVMLAVVTVITLRINGKAALYAEKQRRLAEKLPDHVFDERCVYFPIKKLWNRENPMQRIIVWVGVVVAVSQALQLLSVDIQIGLPADVTDLIWMISAYLMCVLLGAATYLFMLYMLIILNRMDVESKYESQ